MEDYERYYESYENPKNKVENFYEDDVTQQIKKIEERIKILTEKKLSFLPSDENYISCTKTIKELEAVLAELKYQNNNYDDNFVVVEPNNAVSVEENTLIDVSEDEGVFIDVSDDEGVFIDVSEDEGVFVYVPDEEVYDANDKSQKR